MPYISSICVVGDKLAVASDGYEAIHIYGKDITNGVIARMIGHTMGVTSLCAYNSRTLLSGSGDRLVKMWNLDSYTWTVGFYRHGGPVGALCYGKYANDEFLFTGGDDGVVHVWDLKKKGWMFQIRLADDDGKKLLAWNLAFNSAEKSLSILALNSVGHGVIDRCSNHGKAETFYFLKAE
jgi:WD40 repeat protein